MISPTELRIGNWIAIPECAIRAKVKTLDTKRFAVFDEEIDLDPKDVFGYESAEPIPLTPEILEKLSFTKSNLSVDDIWYVQPLFENIHYRLRQFAGQWIFSYGFINYDHELCTMKYVHQLQNGYYFLTGEELNVRL